MKKTLPEAGVAKLRDVNKSTFGNFVDADNRLECWGGADDWEFSFEPEVKKQKPGVDNSSDNVSFTHHDDVQRQSESTMSMTSSRSTLSLTSFPNQPQLLNLNQVRSTKLKQYECLAVACKEQYKILLVFYKLVQESNIHQFSGPDLQQ